MSWLNFDGIFLGKDTVRHMDGMGLRSWYPTTPSSQKLLQEGGDDFRQRALEAGSLEHLGQRNHGKAMWGTRWAPTLVPIGQ